MLKYLIILLTTMLLSATASAHSGMEQSSIMHNVLHISAGVGVIIVLMLVALYSIKRLPKLQKQKINVNK